VRLITIIASAFCAVSCAAPEGDPCQIDSDCAPGLICSLDQICKQPSQVLPPEDPCVDPAGAFEASEKPCSAPTNVIGVSALSLKEEGHGLAGLASLANPTFADAIEKGELAMSLLVDGTLKTECTSHIAWKVDDNWRNGDCTPVHSKTFPLLLPSLKLSFTVYGASFDIATSTLTGYADPDEIKASLEAAGLSEAIVTGVMSSIKSDVDTDDDGVPDKASVILSVGLVQ
jgi:hypothetical protein